MMYASIWDAVADTPEQAANLQLRSAIMQQVSEFVTQRRWTQAVAAKRCGVTQPRLRELLQGRISRFSLDALISVATALGLQARVTLEPDGKTRSSLRATTPTVRRNVEIV